MNRDDQASNEVPYVRLRPSQRDAAGLIFKARPGYSQTMRVWNLPPGELPRTARELKDRTTLKTTIEHKVLAEWPQQCVVDDCRKRVKYPNKTCSVEHSLLYESQRTRKRSGAIETPPKTRSRVPGKCEICGTPLQRVGALTCGPAHRKALSRREASRG